MLACLLPVAVMAGKPPPLLGTIENNYYIAPRENLRVLIPFNVKQHPDNIIRDAVYSTSLDVLFEDVQHNVRYHVELVHPEESDTTAAIETRLFQYQGLVSRAYPGDAILINFDSTANGIKRYLYKQVGNGNVRFHYVQAWPYNKRLVLVRSDFVESIDTPENEDRIINGDHDVIRNSQRLAESIKKTNDPGQ